MAKQRRSAVRAAQVTYAPQPNRQMKAAMMWQELLQARLLATQPVSSEANSREIRRGLFQVNSQMQVMSPAQQQPLLELQALPQD